MAESGAAAPGPVSSPGSARLFAVTGGAGFIGSHLVAALLARGDRVHVLDDLSTGARANLGAVEGHPRLSVTIGDAGDPEVLRPLLEGAHGVFHLAAAVGVRRILERSVGSIRRNLRPTEVCLDAAAEAEVRFVLTSTSEVYGRGKRIPFREDQDLVLGPPTCARWAYATTKLADEFLALAYHRERGVAVSIARLFNVIGPRQTGRYGMVVPCFLQAARAGGPLEVYGDGAQTRTFLAVSDAVRGLLAMMDRPEAVGEIVNLGGLEEISIGALARRVRARFAPTAKLALVPYREAYGEGFEDMRRRVPAIGKAARLLDWHPQVALPEVLEATWRALPRAAAAETGPASACPEEGAQA